ncbi:MAG: GNAT family N-acetyltransferase [Candidatus Odinarchaeota archaeon]
MLIRHIRENELEELLNLYTHLHRQDAPLPDKLMLLSIWKEITQNSLLHYFVVEDNNKIVSSCTLSIIPNLTRGARPYGVIENMVTHTDYRNRGFGTSILRHALDFAWKNNCYKVMLLTGSKDPAIYQFYENAGFKKGIKTGFIAYPSEF